MKLLFMISENKYVYLILWKLAKTPLLKLLIRLKVNGQ